MKVSEKQLIMLVDIAKDTLRFAGVIGGYDPQTRLQLVNDLINQQSNELKDVDQNDLIKRFRKLGEKNEKGMETKMS